MGARALTLPGSVGRRGCHSSDGSRACSRLRANVGKIRNLLIVKGSDINACTRDDERETMLHLALKLGKFEL